jgi:cobyrinic acid a,c-diamide synthase
MSEGLVLAAPSSGCGKTVITLALLRALRRAGRRPGSLKIGPDYIDPGFHRAASGGECRNYDPWAMRAKTLDNQVAHVAAQCDFVIAEGVTGLFDGATDGTGSTADAARRLGWPVLLICDVQGQGASVAALVEGFAHHRADTEIAGVILNRVGSDRHRDILTAAISPIGIPILGMIPRDNSLDLPDRHLGLIQADEQPELDQLIDRAASVMEAEMNLDALLTLAAPGPLGADPGNTVPIPPPGQCIAVARDKAFSFIYPTTLDGWRRAGATISFFSPLANDAPDAGCDAVYLPGGYPELHAPQLGQNETFLNGLRKAAARDATLYGECGGFMVLGEHLTDRDGRTFGMAGLLPVRTSFAEPRLQLGYRKLTLCDDGFLGKRSTDYRGHEFHYSSQIGPEPTTPLFTATDAINKAIPAAGCRRGNIMGAYIHLIDRADQGAI